MSDTCHCVCVCVCVCVCWLIQQPRIDPRSCKSSSITKKVSQNLLPVTPIMYNGASLIGISITRHSLLVHKPLDVLYVGPTVSAVERFHSTWVPPCLQ